eukprot:CAMPEP_0204912752 /NCGR_PEP_ID=MMETSP1397-20131031/10853_1 /ASSEMBLY_ACC=CAM_ASM_000891 /TAXON_ID=49980 /ORGANISM="Climacostomum Climacostomum virens, Strain Stock W-24" /LENGTH=230 /DNA_ID=CAMNT_0052083835 /DNA_START=278 /DNA_END=970 /DNA_ORIENTATION=+
MGTSPAKNVFEEEEQGLIHETYYIGFGRNHASFNDIEIVKACGTEYSASKLDEVAKRLSLNIKNHGSHSRIEEAFAKFSSVSELRVAGILLGQGKYANKLDLLYSVFSQGQIDANQLQALLKAVCKVSLDIFGNLGADGQTNKAGRLRSDHYISICKQAEDRWVQSCKDAYTIPNSKEAFINTFIDKRELTSPQYFRRHCFSFAKANPQGALSKTSTSSAFSRLRTQQNP